MNESTFRYLVPGKLAFGVLLFFLPWIQISCRVTNEGKTETIALMQQSGFDAAVGRVSPAGPLAQMGAGDEDGAGDGGSPAPLIIVYGLVLIAGAAAGFTMGMTEGRRLAMGAAAGIAFLCLLVQSLAGFPLLADAKDSDKMKVGDVEREMELTTDYQPAYYLSFAVCLAAVGGVVAERMGAAKTAKTEEDEDRTSPGSRDSFNDDV